MLIFKINKQIYWPFIFALILLWASGAQAQYFFGPQAIGSNTFFFSMAWQGKPLLGVGYNHRAFGKTFSDYQAELRFPIDKMYRFTDYQLIAGVYKPFMLKRAFVAGGAHFRLEKKTNETQQDTKLSLALTALPSYVYAASTTDGVYATAGLRFSYVPGLLFRAKGTGFVHKAELGTHLDFHLARSLALSINGFLSKSLGAGDGGWKKEGDFYMGSFYRLGRF